jgi:hypothetical protein
MNQDVSYTPKRTAVLAVHGMGSQRPLDTVRGIVNAIWLEGDASATGPRRIWTHPEKSGVDDIDLPVITTNFVPDTDHRVIDFHELYWAHLMSETRATAVLLWLFELARMGPRLKPTINALYWVALVFLCVLVLSVSLLSVQVIVQFAKLVAQFSGYSLFDHDLHSLFYVIFVTISVTSFVAFIAAGLKRAFKLAGPLLGIAFVFALLFAFVYYQERTGIAEPLTNILLPTIIAALLIKATMDWWGLLGLLIVLVISAIAGGFAWPWFSQDMVVGARLPWSITSFWSSIAACSVIGLYLILYASFLQPYLGDAARYFRNSPANVAVRREIRRQAVRMLEELHLSGKYDRVIVVAHSLGTVVAYDMLRAYYSRINDALPDPSLLGEDFEAADRGTAEKSASRKIGRQIIGQIAKAVEDARRRITEGKSENLRAWLVTDFVTLGSPLTHALYLMCRGKTEKELEADFERRTREREFPTCPPQMLGRDYRLTFENPNTHLRSFHHGGQFALTRWTNLYFPTKQLLWGDAIGGQVSPLFGENVSDLAVYTNSSRRDAFFAHVLYWDLGQGSTAPHIVALKNAIDLADTGVANDL